MEFDVVFYRTSSDRCPVSEFLDDLERTDPKDFASLVAGLQRLKQSENHRLPLCRSLGQGLFELRHLGHLNSRVLWFFVAGQKIVAVHGIRNKGQSIRAADLRLALERKRDWQIRRAHERD